MKIYIAGPDVFSPDAVGIGEHYKQLCGQYGFEGIYPLDGSSMTKTDQITAQAIFAANLESIKKADVVVANLNPFRGQCVDDGTAFEIGYACALGKQIFGYLDDSRSLIERYGRMDDQRWNVEDFGHPVNLMLAEAVSIVEGGFEDCLRHIAAQNY